MLQLDLFSEIPKWIPPNLGDIPDLSGSEYIAVDTETHDPDLKLLGPGFINRGSYVLGVSISTESYSCYLPLRHYSQNCADPQRVREFLVDLLSCQRVKLFANASYDLDALRSEGIEVNGPIWDVQVVDAIIDETHFSYSLENIAQRRCGYGKDDSLEKWLKLHNLTMSDLKHVDAGVVAKYAIRDADLLPEIYYSQLEDIDAYNLSEAIKRETELTRVLWKMHQRGVPVDVSKAEQLSDEYRAKAEAAIGEARRLAGYRFKPSGKSLVGLLDHLGLPYPKTAKGNPSVGNDHLLSLNHPVTKLICEHRRLEKVRKDYIEGVILKYEHKGRIHPQWFQARNSKKGEEGVTGASTGRVTGSRPNLTQIPTRTAIGAAVRSCVLPEDGDRYAKLDYSSQEPRITVDLACKAAETIGDDSGFDRNKLETAFKVRDLYLVDKTTDLHAVAREMILEHAGVDISRRDAKTINLGLTYGMQINTLSEKLGVSVDEAKSLSNAYHAAMPFVGEIANIAKSAAMARGYVRTIGGGLRHFNQWVSTNFSEKEIFDSKHECMQRYGSAQRMGLHKAFNAIVQGTAANQMKQALINLDREGHNVLLQVYDETGVSVGSDKETWRVVEIMEHSLDISVPSLVEPYVGGSWGENHELKAA